MRIVPKAVYDVGDAPWVKVTFRDTNGIATDPSSVTAAISRPSGVVDSYSYGVDAELVRLGSGVYRIRVSLGEAGEWVVRMAGVGVVESAAEMLLRVQASGVLDPPVDPEDAGYPSVAWSQITGVPTTIFLPAPHSHPATDITTGVFADARIAASNVTQHQAALSIATTQLTGVLQAAQFPALTGDVTSVAGALATTLASTAVTAGSYGSASQVPTYTVDAKGRLTTAANVAIAIATSQVTSGTFADARIAASNVTQHQAALSVAWSQLTSIPSTFTPAAHVHAATDITTGTLDNARTTAVATNTVSTIVARDASGNFAAGTITATFSGNLTGNVTGNASGTAATITGALALANTPLTTRGDLLVATTATPILGRLAKGTQYQVLTGGATDPTWGAVDLAQATAVTGTLPLGNGGTGATTLAGAGIVAGSASITTANALLIGASAGVLGQSDVSLASGIFSRAGTVGLAATGSNVVTVSTNGVERFRVASDGLVSITGSGGSVIQFTNGQGLNTSGTLYLDTTTTGDILFRPAVTTALTIKNAGNVLIGTTTDDGASKLQVAGVVRVKTGNIQQDVSTFIGFTGNTAVDSTNYALYGDATNSILNVASGGSVSLKVNNVTQFSISSTSVATLYNPVATTGVTSLVVRAGAGQADASLLTMQNAAGDAKLFFQINSGQSVVYSYYDASNYSIWKTASGASQIGTVSNIPFTLIANNTSRIAIDGTGIGFFGVTPVARAAALTAANASALNTGDATSDTVIGNMRTRIGELETKLQAYGLLN